MPVMTLIWSFVWSLITSRAGQLAMAFCFAWIWAQWRADNAWESKIAIERATWEQQYRAEVDRQKAAAKAISDLAEAREQADKAVIGSLEQQIQEFDKQEKANANSPQTAPAATSCFIDSGFASVVQQLDATSRKTQSTRRPR